MDSNADRVILHCDLNGFFASVEGLSHPETRGKPMAVCGDPKMRHGIILAKNEEAKKFGVATAETIWSAKRKCPDLILIQAHHEEYEKYSRLVNAIYNRFTPRVEPFGIDESWLDVSGSQKLFGSGREIADKIRATIKGELGLTVSIGVSFNKIFAKLGSDYKKPDATTVFGRDEIERIVYKMPVSSMLYVGKNTAEALRKMGIITIGELASRPLKILKARFGKFGETLHESACGTENSPVAFYGDTEEAKSVGNSITFKRDLLGARDIKLGIMRVAEKVSSRLSESGVKASSLQVVIKGADFSYMARQVALSFPTNLRAELVNNALNLVSEYWNPESPIRMLGITACKLCSNCEAEQGDLFTSATRKRTERAEDALREVRKKFGSSSIKFGGSLDCDF